jgi:predicted nucleotidyltransferase
MCKVLPMNVGTRQIRVAEIKQKYIRNIIDAARECDLIDRVVLFGSSLQERCLDSSDIDIAVFGNQPRSRALTSKKYERFARQLFSFDNHAQAYDILYFRSGSSDSNPILHEISKGEELYVRN